jgi:hypothetical protein
MKTIIALAAAAAATVVAVAPANAADGCGRGYHRNQWGHCRPNWHRGPGVVAVTPGGALVVDRWYPGRGYWNGNRYYMHRRHWNNGWRYW